MVWHQGSTMAFLTWLSQSLVGKDIYCKCCYSSKLGWKTAATHARERHQQPLPESGMRRLGTMRRSRNPGRWRHRKPKTGSRDHLAHCSTSLAVTAPRPLASCGEHALSSLCVNTIWSLSDQLQRWWPPCWPENVETMST